MSRYLSSLFVATNHPAKALYSKLSQEFGSTKDTLCTRFATELILRRAPIASATVAITPGVERSEEEVERPSKFNAASAQIDDVHSLVEAAEEAMGLPPNQNIFSPNVLRVEITGPK